MMLGMSLPEQCLAHCMHADRQQHLRNTACALCEVRSGQWVPVLAHILHMILSTLQPYSVLAQSSSARSSLPAQLEANKCMKLLDQTPAAAPQPTPLPACEVSG